MVKIGLVGSGQSCINPTSPHSSIFPLLLLLLSSLKTPIPFFILESFAFFDLIIVQFGELGLQESFSAGYFGVSMAQSKATKFSSRASDEPKQPKINPSEPNPPHVVKAREGGQPKKSDESLPKQENANLKTNDSHQRHGRRSMNSADDHNKPSHALKSAGVAVEQSPIHPRTERRGSGSQPSSSDSLQGPSGKPRHRTNARQASNHVGGGPAVPEFGAWNKNPEQAEGYTDVFNQVITDRRTPGNNPSNTAATPRRTPKQQSKRNCFSSLFKCFSSTG